MFGYIIKRFVSPKNLLELTIYLVVTISIGLRIPYTGIMFFCLYLPIIFLAIMLSRYIVNGIAWKDEIPEMFDSFDHPTDFDDVEDLSDRTN
jgi:hypothetical protein